MYACIYVCMYVCMYVRITRLIGTYDLYDDINFANKTLKFNLSMCVYMHVCICVCICVCMYVCTHY